MVCHKTDDDVSTYVFESILEDVSMWGEFRQFAEDYWFSRGIAFEVDHYDQMSDEEFKETYNEEEFQQHHTLREEALQKFLQTDNGKLIRLFGVREDKRTEKTTEWLIDLSSQNRKLRNELLKYVSEDRLEAVLTETFTNGELALFDETMGTPLNVVE
jgi:hypothetical protein